jgi:outer membrane receptor protein involved in Fe transport
MRDYRLLLSLGASALVVPCPALAQTATTPATSRPPATDANATAEQSGAIIVTAQKRTARLLDVPLAVTALDASALTRRGEVKLEEYSARVPGLSVTNGSTGGLQSSVIIRGISTGDGGNPTVAVYVDDAPFNSTTQASGGTSIPDLDPGDLERIEVLRGPQGTLYGASSLGGLIKYVTKVPNVDKFEGRIELGGTAIDGGGLGYSARARVNVPISSSAAVSVSGFSREDPGFLDDPVNGKKDRNRSLYDGGRAAVLLKPANNLTINLSTIQQRIRVRGNPLIDVDPVTGKPLLPDLKATRVPGTDTSHYMLSVYDLAIKGDFDGFQVVSDTSYVRRRFRSTLDFSPVVGPALASFGIPGAGGDLFTRLGTNKVTQELRATADVTSSINLLAGVFYTHEDNTQLQRVDALDPASGDVIAGLPELFTTIVPSTYEEIAGFANATVKFGSRFDIAAGVRVSHNHQTSASTITGVIAPSPLQRAKSSETPVTFSVNPRFRVNPNLIVYARVASGFRPGGPNVGSAGGEATYRSDKVTSYEIGTKGTLLDNKLTIDLSGFYVDWRNIQVLGTNPATGVNFFTNAGKARSKGVEGAFVYRVFRGLSVNGNIAYTDAYLRSDIPPPTFAVAGDRLPNTPRLSAQVGADYSFPLTESLEGSFGASYHHVGFRYAAFAVDATTPRFRLPAYDTLDLRAGLKLDGYTLDVFARNITDKRAYLAGSALGAIESVAINQPRTFGIVAAKAF